MIMVLLRTYSCNTTDSVNILKCKVLQHYSSLYAAREVSDPLFFCYSYYSVGS